MRNPMSRAELHHLPRPRHTKPRLQRSRLVINATVDHSAIVSRLMPSHSRLFLQNHHAQARELLGRLHGKRKPHNPPANHRNVISHKPMQGRASAPVQPVQTTAAPPETILPHNPAPHVDPRTKHLCPMEKATALNAGPTRTT